MMKRILCLFLAGLMLLAAAACAAKQQNAQAEAPTAAPVNTEQPTEAPAETPTEEPTVTEAPNAALQYVEAATVEEFLAAIAPNTKVHTVFRDPEVRQQPVLILFIYRREHKHERRDVRSR